MRTATCLRTSKFPELLYSECSCSYANNCNGGPYAKTGKWISSYMTAASSTKWKKKSKLGNIECFWRRGASSCISHRLIEVMKRGRGERRVESPRNNTPAYYRNTRGKEKERGKRDLLFIENSKLLRLSSLLCKSPDVVVTSIGPTSPCCFKGKC